MKPRSLLGAAAAAAAIHGLVGAPALAADELYDSARQAIAEAQRLQQAGEWPQAQARLQQADQDCGTDAAGGPCRLLVRFAQGYLGQREAERSPADAPKLLATSADRYRAVLLESPEHEPTLKNLGLVYRDLGDRTLAVSFLERAARSDRSGTGRALLLLGQIQRESGQFGPALAAFDQAAALNPADPAAPRAIVALYTDEPPGPLPDLLPRLSGWAATLPAVAEEGYRRVLIRTAGSPMAEQILPLWVELIARQGWVSPSSFDSMPRQWPPLGELARYVAKPEIPPTWDAWWMKQPLRRSILAQVALAVSQAPEARADPERALARLQTGMQICPGYEEYIFRPEMKSAWPTRMELARQMLSLLSGQPGLDPKGQRQRYLIGELFAGKAGAYQTEDLAAMQRFHMTLGRWYADRGEWEASGAMNARFQLEHAIDVAQRRLERGDSYQPLQEEKVTLAGGYLKLHVPESARARAMYLQAAAAYLDTDQLQPAADALAAAERIAAPAAPPAEKERSALLRRILATRRSLAEAPAPADFEKRPAQDWLLGGTQDAFVSRQRFKTLSDLTLQSLDAGDEATATFRSAAAFESALAVNAMVGTADLIRLDRVKAVATARADLADRRTVLGAVRPRPDSGIAAWSLYVPSETRSLYPSVSADAVVAGRIDAALRRDIALAGRDVRFSVDAGNVRLHLPGAAVDVARTLERLHAVKGVAAVTMMPQ